MEGRSTLTNALLNDLDDLSDYEEGDDDDNEFDDGEGHSRRVAGPNLGCMTSILRLLSPNHMLFVEERLRKRERVREGVKELQGVSENQISCGIDALLLDPKEEQQVMERVAKRANARRLKRQRRARRLVEKNKREAEQVREREKARRLKNASCRMRFLGAVPWIDCEKRIYTQ